MNWQAGDLALIIDAAPLHVESLVGKTGVLVVFFGDYVNEQNTLIKDAWRVNVAGFDWIVSENCLRKPYDGHNLAHWKDCVWQPDKVEVLM